MAMLRNAAKLPLPLQALRLRQDFPSAIITVRAGRLTWRGVITPTPLSRAYTVQISYALGGYPKVIVISPALEPDSAGRLPHLYREGCLCLHKAHEWDWSLHIADTTIPWTAEWLAYYELWKRAGQWYGDGSSPALGEPDKSADVRLVDETRPNRARRRRSARSGGRVRR